jgi:hypothetical protein
MNICINTLHDGDSIFTNNNNNNNNNNNTNSLEYDKQTGLELNASESVCE